MGARAKEIDKQYIKSVTSTSREISTSVYVFIHKHRAVHVTRTVTSLINCFTGGVTPWESNRVARAFCCRKELVMPAVTSGICSDLIAYFSYSLAGNVRNRWFLVVMYLRWPRQCTTRHLAL